MRSKRTYRRCQGMTENKSGGLFLKVFFDEPDFRLISNLAASAAKPMSAFIREVVLEKVR